MEWDLLQIIWLDGGSPLIGRPAGHAFILWEQSNELYKTELKMNCRRLIFTLQANIFVVSEASVDDKMIKYLQI